MNMDSSQATQDFNKQIMSYFISSTYGNEVAVLNSLKVSCILYLRQALFDPAAHN